MYVGYARVSTFDQHLDLQKDALTRAGCERIFTDTRSGAKAERPGLAQALTFMRANDVLVVWKLVRLGRSLKNLIDVVTELDTLGIGFRSVMRALIPRPVVASSFFTSLARSLNLSVISFVKERRQVSRLRVLA